MDGELLSILSAIERDKGIDREILIQAVESALVTAARKSVGASDEEDVTVTIDRNTGQMSVNAAGRSVKNVDFSRIAAQTAKQVIIQKIREAERDVVFTEFQGRVGDIVNGTVHRFERGDIIVELGRTEAILPRSERIPHEEYRQGDRIQGYILEVHKATKEPWIVLSRTHEGFIGGLFALEVPEISEGIVEIRGVAREAGDRTKIAVSSKDEKVDCVGACVGMRGTRVKNIVRELHGEKVDIIRWYDEIEKFIEAALSPAKISEIRSEEEARQALVIVDDDQLSLAIGKRGQNVRLASKLCGWQLEIKSKAQMAAGESPISEVDGIGATTQARMAEVGITTIGALASMSIDQLTEVKGIGKKTAEKLLEVAQAALKAATKAQQTPAAEAASSEGVAPDEASLERPPESEAAGPHGEKPERKEGREPSSEEAVGDTEANEAFHTALGPTDTTASEEGSAGEEEEPGEENPESE